MKHTLNFPSQLKTNKIVTLANQLLILLVIGFHGIQNLYATAPLTEGWWRVYSRWISQGMMPYKDFNLIVPPGMPYIDLFFSKIVGQSFYNERFIGLLLKCLIALLIFEILRKLISQYYAAVLSISGTILLYSTEVVILFDYNYFAIFFLILSTYFWQISENPKISGKKAGLYSLSSGFFLSASLLVKLNYAFFLILFFAGATFVKLFFSLKPDYKTIYLNLASKSIGLFIPITCVSLYFHSQESLSPMINSLFRESAGAKGSVTAALFNWIFNLFDSYNYRREIATVVFSVLIYFGLEKYFLPKYYNTQTESFNFLNLKIHKKHLNLMYVFSLTIFLCLSIFNLQYLALTGIESWWIEICKEIAYLIIPHTFMIPVFFVLILFFWKLRKNEIKWVPLLSLSLTLIWGAGTSGGLNWYATAIPFVVFLAWVSTITNYRGFLTAVTLFTSITVATTTYANWIHSPYDWWGYRTPPVYLASTTSDFGLTKGLQMDGWTKSVLKFVEEDLKEVQYCSGGLLVFPHMPIFQLDLNSQPNRRDAIYWFDFVSQSNIKKAILEIEDNPPAGFVIVNVPKFVWDGHSKAFLGGKKYAQENLIATLKRESEKGYTSKTYRLYKNEKKDWSLNVYTRNSCEKRK